MTVWRRGITAGRALPMLVAAVACAAPPPSVTGTTPPAAVTGSRDELASAPSEELPCNLDDQDNDAIPDELDDCPDEVGEMCPDGKPIYGCPRLLRVRYWNDIRYRTFRLPFCPDRLEPPPTTQWWLDFFASPYPIRGPYAGIDLIAWVLPYRDREAERERARERALVVRAELVRHGVSEALISFRLHETARPAGSIRPNLKHQRVDLTIMIPPHPAVPIVPPEGRRSPPAWRTKPQEPVEVPPTVLPAPRTSRECGAHLDCVVDQVPRPSEACCFCPRSYARHKDDPTAPEQSGVSAVRGECQDPCGGCAPNQSGEGGWRALCVQRRCTLVSGKTDQGV